MEQIGKQLGGKTALITGASHRLGRAVAESLADQGVHVILHFGTSRDAAEQLATRLRERGVRSTALGADLRKPDEVQTLVARAVDAVGPIDLLINNASIFPGDRFADFRWEDLERNLQVNTWAPLCLIRAFAHQQRDGIVVNLLDTRVTAYDPTHFSYGLSKHLLRTLTEHLALELAPRIRVNGVAPGLVLPPPGEDRDYLDRRAGSVPLRSAGEPADIVRAVRFLLESPFVTGQVLYVDGGAHLGGALDG